MSSILEIENNRDKCQKFTPLDVVDNMLDMAGYTTNLMGQKVLENSFGSGHILKSIVRRYINDAISRGVLPQNISVGIENDIYGIELDGDLYAQCINELDEIIKEYKLPKVKWSLYNEDALSWENPVSFQFIIGNPPYIAYRYIDEENRSKLKGKYASCKDGKFDYCYAFIESAISMLDANGRLVQLIPSNIYKNVFADNLRKILLPQIVSIWEYPDKKMFGSTLTSSSIFLFDKRCVKDHLEYRNMTEKHNIQIPKKNLNGKWVFKEQTEEKTNLKKFGDCFHASIAVATQLNKAFLISNNSKDIEHQVLRNAAAPRALRYGKKEAIIFPYYYDHKGKLKTYTEKEFEEKYPLAIQHLEANKEKLLERDADSKAKWFEYGRTQALAHLNQEKLLLSTVITNKVEIYELDAETIPYSGIYITVRDKEYDLKKAKQILESPDFMRYVKTLGISVSGKSKRITCKDINNFKFTEE